MNFQLLKQYFGTNKSESLLDINDEDIDDLCYIENFGFLFLSKKNNCIGYGDLLGNVEFPWIGEDGTKVKLSLKDPCSICYNSQSNTCFVIERDGRRVTGIDLSSFNSFPLLDPIYENKIDKFFAKTKNVGDIRVSSFVDGMGSVYVSNSFLNRCYKFEHYDIEMIMGNKGKGYSVCNDSSKSLLNEVGGIVLDENFIYISDTGNHCIRKFNNDNIFIVAGNPKFKGDEGGNKQSCLLSYPSKMAIKNKMIYFIDTIEDTKKVKYLSLSDITVGTIYESPNIISIDIDENKNLFVLEKK